MRVTTALFLRHLLSTLHPPSPISPRESQLLLRRLDKSFKKQLDKIHPSPSVAKEAAHSDPIPLDVSGAADRHLDSVLHHPFLETSVPKDRSPFSERLSAITIFENAVRNGVVTGSVLRTCSLRYCTAVSNGEAALSNGLLGTKIAAWLASAPDSSKQMFFTDYTRLQRIVYIMYLDGLEEVVWTWLSMLYKRDWVGKTSSSISNETYLVAEDTLISTMIQTSLKKGAGQDAIHQFVKASEYRVASTPKSRHDGGNLVKSEHWPLVRSWQRISAWLLLQRKNFDIPLSSFNSLLKYSPHPWQTLISKGVLMLYHPHRNKRSSESLFHELQSKDVRGRWLSWFIKGSPKRRTRQLTLLLDAAELSIYQHRVAESQFFLDLAQTLQPDMVISTISSSPAKRLVQVREKIEAQVPDGLALT